MEKAILLAIAASFCTATASICQRLGARGIHHLDAQPQPGRTSDQEAACHRQRNVTRIASRLPWQRIFDRPKPPSFWAVVDEGVLRRRIGGAKVMADQLVHLAEMGERASIKIHVIPADAGAHMGLLGALAIAGFAGDAPGIVYFESPDEGQTTRDPGTVAKVTLTFETLRSEALPRGASRDLILKVAGEYGRDVEDVQLQRR